MSNGRNLAKVERTDRTVNVSACAACREAFAATGNACSECSQDAEDWARIQEGLLPLLGSRYQLRCRLGSGSVGEVYRANDTMLDRDVAIKRVRLDTFVDVAERERMRERTIREAKTAAKLKHPHIVTIHDIIDTPETSFIVMEFIDGFTLESIIKKKRRLGLDETLNILGPTAQALDRAHENGVVHRDVKPANIMLEGETGVKVTDFGIAKSESATSLTATGSILGTPYYMSPEQARGDGNVDGRSDLFALGCVLFECLTGQRAFRGRSLVAVLMAIANEEPAAVDFESLGIHGDIGAIFKRALAKDPSKRFASAVELIDSVRSLPRIEPRCDEAGEQSKLVAPLPVVTRREMGKKDSFDSRLQGNLKDTSAAELIRDFYGARHTGILHLCRQKVEKRIYFKKGNIVFANSEEESDRLGEFLIASGQLDRATFELASKTMKHARQRFGRALIELGVLSQEELEDAVRRQIEAIIYSVIQWESGGYGFEFLDRPVEEDIVLNLSTAELILGGVRQISSAERIRDVIGDLERPSLEQFQEMRMRNGLSQMSLSDLYVWMLEHEDVFLVTDVKERNVAALRWIARTSRGLQERFIPQVYQLAEFSQTRELGYRNIILTLYRIDDPPERIFDFAMEHDLFAITMPAYRALNDGFAERLTTRGVFVYVHTINSLEKWKGLRHRGVTGIYTDFIRPADVAE